jgi:hypothetical protein
LQGKDDKASMSESQPRSSLPNPHSRVTKQNPRAAHVHIRCGSLRPSDCVT